MKGRQGIDHHGSRQAGFTLLEMVVVLAILTTLAGLIAPYFAVTMRIERTDSTVRFMDDLEESLVEYGRDLLTFPVSLDELLQNDAALTGWRGPYAVHRFSATGTSLSGDVRQDAWSQDYVYTRTDASHCSLRSLGDDRTQGTSDDIVKDLDLTPKLRAETLRREQVINDAITSYNSTHLPATPLSTDFATLRATLISGGYLGNASWHASDAWGDAFVLDPPAVSPPSRITSTHTE